MKNKDLATGGPWDLEDLYRGDEDPRLCEDLGAVRDKALGFVALFKGKINNENLDPKTLLSAIREYESIHEMGMKPHLFAYLYHSSDTRDHNRIRLLQKVRETWSEISQILTFFELEIKALPKDFLKKLAAHKDLINYRHFLLNQIQWKPHALSEAEEKIIKRGHLSGRDAFLSLYDQFTGALSFSVEIEGKSVQLNIYQVLSLLRSPDRLLREKAFDTFLKELEKHGPVFKNILNALLLAHHQEDVERGHPFPMHRIHLINEVNESIIENMMGVVEGYYPLARRYFREKARRLGLEKLKSTDIFAPLKENNLLVSFSDAMELILEAAENLHPVFHSTVHEIFENNRIDAGVRTGKQNGAFCKSMAPSLRPYISMGYAGDISDLMTLAHEVGHGIHYRFCSEQGYMNFDPPPILAEAASTFMEMVVIEHLMKKKDYQKVRPALLALQIEGIMTTVFRQNVLTRFEQTIHHKRQDHLLSAREICRLWWDENSRFYGEEVEIIDGYHWGWTYIPHFFHRPFYCYSYIFGNLLSIMLFQNYQEKGDGFLVTIIDLLKAGSSRAPIEMIKEMGLDIGKRCWEPAFQYIGDLIDSWTSSKA